ncbi:bifunctional diaminohydroxyphosphoribosylaminopyrimidine deaminase/5-amino-6-(5-phosphoribosylamino)uracil reductase RibD [uncultured Clostridium sp.]|uniref:Riboflavin biosynthesis protein RibD n=1 Tax=Clostridium lapidicellarium TaxID=3240931 RepID=A0ABV4E064_9CLOT
MEDLEDSKYMNHAIVLAKKGEGWVSPNPMVGAVIVKKGKIIGEGYHKACGKPHAERNALASCVESAKGATLYVTLEPCCHYGRTPPCTDAIIRSGISKVIIGSGDPNPKVCGKGVSILRKAGITVKEGVLKKECDEMNTIFFHYIVTGTPYLAMKYAMTADGKIATVTGASQWITGETAREHVHRLRHKYSAIMVGIGTVLHDDPLLNCRLKNGKNPIRIICDSYLHIPVNSRICQTAGEIPTIVATTMTNSVKVSRLKALGVKILTLPNKNGKVDLPILMQKLGEFCVDSILLEGGGVLNYSALNDGLVQEMYVYIAPKIFGGKEAKTPVEGKGVLLPKECFQFAAPEISVLGDDLLLRFKKI